MGNIHGGGLTSSNSCIRYEGGIGGEEDTDSIPVSTLAPEDEDKFP